MADQAVTDRGRKMQENSPDNGVVTINDESDIMMLSTDEEAPPGRTIISEEILISDDECIEKSTNLEEIIISDDENDNEAKEESMDAGEVTEVAPPESTSVSKDESIEIKFSSTELFDKYKQEFRTFCQGFKQFKYTEEQNKLLLTKDTDLKDLSVIKKVVDSVEDAVESNEIDQNEKKSHKIDNLFILDTEPTSQPTNCPIYKSKYKFIDEPLPEEPKEQDSNKKKEGIVISCFNCNGNHHVRNCPVRRNHRRINKVRKSYGGKPFRYHEEGVNINKPMIPGEISDTLRRAIGIRKYDIPPHVYKMRVMGYPPGWLEEARVCHYNIAVFGSDGKKDGKSGTLNPYSILPEKIISYPGFNCKPDRRSRDEYNFYGVPPYSTALSKENMIEFVNNMSHHEAEQQSQVERKQKSPSPSLNDLELQKRQLLEQLTTNENDDSNPQMSSNDTINATTANKSSAVVNNTKQKSLDLSTNVDCDETNPGMDLDSTINNTRDEDVSTAVTPSTPSTKMGVINGSLTGTPILKALSPYARLPSLDNFQKDVSPVINFENLANASGKYEQMTTVLQKVRSTLKSRFQT